MRVREKRKIKINLMLNKYKNMKKNYPKTVLFIFENIPKFNVSGSFAKSSSGERYNALSVNYFQMKKCNKK